MPVPASSHHLLVTLKPSDEQVLKWLQRLHYLSARQLCRLGYSSGSLTYVQTKLKRLTEAGYCQRIWLPKRAQYGSAPSVYTLARRGLNHLRALGLDINNRFHPAEKRTLSYLFLDHTLELNDVLISLDLLCQAIPSYRLAGFMHERELKRQPIKVVTKDGREAAVIPDAWLDLRLHDQYQVCLAIELDRGTEEQKRWRQKVANLLAYAGGPYQEAFGTRSLTFTVITTAGEKRLMDLVRWTEAELESQGERAQGDLFLFTNLNESTAETFDVFLARCWLQPFQRQAVALLEGYD